MYKIANYLNFNLHAAPSGPPTNFQVRADTSRSLVLSWDPPLPHHQNGIVRMYTVTVALNNVQLTNISTTANTIRVTALIRPFRTYMCSVVAETVAVGPATENIAVQTPEDSEWFLYALHVCYVNNDLLLVRMQFQRRLLFSSQSRRQTLGHLF